jgi:protein phosphatase
LLCSDGLSDLVADNQLAKIVVESPGVMEAASDLVAAALAAGGTDNVTAVVMEAEAPPDRPLPSDDPPLQEDA